MNIKKAFREFMRFLYRSRRTLLLIIVVAIATIISNTLITVWPSLSQDVNVPAQEPYQ